MIILGRNNMSVYNIIDNITRCFQKTFIRRHYNLLDVFKRFFFVLDEGGGVTERT